MNAMTCRKCGCERDGINCEVCGFNPLNEPRPEVRMSAKDKRQLVVGLIWMLGSALTIVAYCL